MERVLHDVNQELVPKMELTTATRRNCGFWLENYRFETIFLRAFANEFAPVILLAGNKIPTGVAGIDAEFECCVGCR